MAKTKDNRYRTWGCIVYPDSMPANWRDILDSNHIAWAESPLHCFDVEETGEKKKDHFHVALSFEGKKSLDQVKEILSPVTTCLPIPLNSLRGYVRYMAHLDNPEKYQYPIEQIIGHGGLDVEDLLRLSTSARYRVLKEICDFCSDNDIFYFSDLCAYAYDNHIEDWIPIIVDNNTYFISNYIRDLRFKLRDSLNER